MPTVFALLVVLIAGLGPGEEPEYVPLGNEAYSLDLELDGYVNGRMDPSRLMTVNGCTLERDAAYLFSVMVDAAKNDGIFLGYEDCYRTFNSQAAAYERRCPVVETAIFGVDQTTGERVQTGTKKERECSGPPVAPAGRSNHGWGRAVDFASGRSVLTCYDEAFHWLKVNAHRFGWVHPDWAHCGKATQEPWHWEFAGVTDPTLVRFVTIDPALIPALE
ncbi:MAG TPA: M15 family metallopeptidase [Acidimicrobiia bacterium]|nr:M15 family metallopeptidase [Acidimicrobiia bacterium]